MIYTAKGKVVKIGDVETFASGFTKRQIVIDRPDERFNGLLALALTKDRCSLADGLGIGEEVEVTFSVGAREYNGRYYTDVNCLSLTSLAAPAEVEFTADVPGSDDEIPF